METDAASAPPAAFEQQMTELLRQFTAMQTQMQTLQGQLQTVSQENRVLRDEQERLGTQPTQGQTGQGSGGVGTDSALVSKWAPDSFSGKQDDWRSWSTKFRSFVGAMKQGLVGKWMDYAKSNRDSDCHARALEPAAGACAAVLYSSLIATCEGKAFAIVENSGDGEGLEAWNIGTLEPWDLGT